MTVFREHTFLGTTQSLCPDCLTVVPAKIIAKQGRVYFRKQCATHGVREDFVCSDARMFDRMEFSLPGKVPPRIGVEPRLGCPHDCGLCTEHEQHTCIGLLEINSDCNLECPLCFASSGPGGDHLSLEDCVAAIDHLVAAEGRAEVLQLSGGEPTIHPQFLDVLRAACERPIDIVMINTNGVRLAKDAALIEQLEPYRKRIEVYLQFDGFDDAVSRELRGASLVETKLRAIERLGEAGFKVILVCTLQTDVNEHEIGRIVEFAMQRPHVTGVSFQPATYVGRHMLPEQLDRRITFPDIIRGIVEQTEVWETKDFLPLPCAHPNAHSLAYAYRGSAGPLPLTRFIDIERHLDLLANGITFTRGQARELIAEFLERSGCNCQDLIESVAVRSANQNPDRGAIVGAPNDAAVEFFQRALTEDLSPADVFRITTTSFMDAYNFDVRQLMKSCVHFVLPSGHLIPFSAYNLFYRDGRLPLPPLTYPRDTAAAEPARA